MEARAAYPVNFAVAASRNVSGVLEVDYTWQSSSGRMADLDGIVMGEFVWYTMFGYYMAPSVFPYKYPNPPFDVQQGNGIYKNQIPNPTLGTVTDFHGDGFRIVAKSEGFQIVKQYYHYTITDGFTYPVHYNPSDMWDGDARGEVKFRQSLIAYYVTENQNGTWEYVVYKVSGNNVDGSATTQLTFPLPWIAG